jgi:hypothetical protein
MTGRDRTRTAARYTLVLAVLAIALGYASAFLPAAMARVGPWLLAVAVPAALFATMILGAVRPGRGLGWLAVPFLLVFLLVAGGFVVALSLPPDGAEAALVFGLPRRAAVILYGVGFLPLFMLPLVYAATFESLTLSEADIARVRAARLSGAVPTGVHE